MLERILLSSPHMGTQEQRYIAEVFSTNWVAPAGPMIERFEREVAALTDMSNVVALSSGSAALHLALRIAGIGKDDPVWCPTMTFIGGVAPILYQGGEPFFLDVDPDTLLLDLNLLEQGLGERPTPRAIITTDLYGSAIDIKRMSTLRDQYNFIWISDTAEAVGSRVHDHHAGYGADYVIFSFNGNKIITTSGGGALACRNSGDAEKARFLATQARDPAPHYQHTTYGYNYRMSAVCAAIGVGQLEVLKERVAARRTIHAAYRNKLGNQAGIRFHDESESGVSNRWLTTVEFDPTVISASPENIRLSLEAENIETRPLWKPMHLQPVFRSAGIIGGKIAEQAFSRGLCLPSGSIMEEKDVDRVTHALLKAIQK